MFGGSESVRIAAGTLRCAYPDVALELTRTDGSVDRVALPYPTAGLGGLELVVSADERFVALFVYSGQSEQGWELFEVDPAAQPSLRHVSSLPYVHGEGLAPVFSPDSRMLAMAVTGGWLERGSGRHAEEMLAPEARGEILVDWGMLYVQQLPTGEVQQSPIGTWIRRSMEIDDLYGWDLYEPPRFVGRRRLALPLPWGATLELDLPLGGPITTSNATTRPRTEY